MTAAAEKIDFADPALYINRQLSWLAFNDRVLAQANDSRHPLLERLRFVSISETNMDEFFMIRVSGLERQASAERVRVVGDRMTPEEQLNEIHARADAFFAEQRRILGEELLPELEREGIVLPRYADLSEEKRRHLREKFVHEILPILTPLAIDPSHPFPHISNLSLNLLVVIHDEGRRVLARVKVPNNVPRYMHVPPESGTPHDGRQHTELVHLEEVISANLDELFPGKQIAECYVFQVTRDADLVIQEDEAADLLRAVESELGQRRFGDSVRLVVPPGMPAGLRTWLAGHLGIEHNETYEVEEPIGLADLDELTKLDRPNLLYPPLVPRVPQELQTSEGILAAIEQGDILLYHPYDSFVPVSEFVRTAAADPGALAIKQTLYRVGSHSPIVESLLEARDEDTQVAVLVELKARFDEEPNIGWARQLEAEGVHVAYGLVGLKTHAKVCMIVRREPDGLRRYVHLGTGNYNPATARVYTDFSYFTDDPEIAEDCTDLFNYLTGYSQVDEYLKLLVAPVTLRQGLLQMIEEQTECARRGEPSRIMMKANALTDPEIIQALYTASQAGVPIDLVIRGICCLRPGIEGVSETIRVVSLVGRFLEHARIYLFGEDETEQAYLGSADLMQRNLDRRVETLFPLRQPQHRTRVRRILELQLADTVNAWELCTDGTYQRRQPGKKEQPLDSQARLLKDPLE